ncbi:hypothetical protein VPH80_002030 [Vibrio parahaemolyticus]|uniref:hypothetical protein n=1 Tax=Vibrio alginolyticus TaxID=663 RepID=UPI001E13ACAA|nr:hypothetical protein [Vibrio alginolyticus]EHR7289761.1 hypothetical protein [Vibrio parahaemolyticus]MBR9789008.1 hypothetical protein [Vibrionaceae bacterium]EMC9922857.1 hypothetical protein [Vibrio parahaemolyticus]MCG6322510.1 hypothetical protein [Vibrio alginolyticus]MCS0292961.1 hypothetical protein [Vibrio alginolyticus]
MAKNNNNIAQRAVTTRLTIGDYVALQAEAEAKGSNPAQVLRMAWSQYLQNSALESRLDKLENRMTRRTFEIVSVVAGLSPMERKEALNQIKKYLEVTK